MPNIDQVIEILEKCSERGHRALEQFKMISSENAPVRIFKGEEMRQVAGLKSTNTIYKAIREGRIKGLEPGQKKTHGVNLEAINEMQRVFNTSPRRKDEEEPVVISFTNFKGGCWKTTTSWYCGSYLANLGYRVLLVDLDPQASLTQSVGILSDIETNHESSLGPYILNEATTLPVSAMVRDTYCPNMKIIPSTLELAGVEYALSNEIVMARESGANATERMKYWFYRVQESLMEVKYDYDVVIVDGTPAVGLLPINIVFGADSIVVPVPTEVSDYASTIAFCDLFKDQLETVRSVFTHDLDSVPYIYFLPTRFAPSEHNATTGSEIVLDVIRETFEDLTLQTVVKKHDGVVSNLGAWRRTVFDVNGGDLGINRVARKKAMANYTAVFDEVMNRAVTPFWPSKRTQLEGKGVYA